MQLHDRVSAVRHRGSQPLFFIQYAAHRFQSHANLIMQHRNGTKIIFHSFEIFIELTCEVVHIDLPLSVPSKDLETFFPSAIEIVSLDCFDLAKH